MVSLPKLVRALKVKEKVGVKLRQTKTLIIMNRIYGSLTLLLLRPSFTLMFNALC